MNELTTRSFMGLSEPALDAFKFHLLIFILIISCNSLSSRDNANHYQLKEINMVKQLVSLCAALLISSLTFGQITVNDELGTVELDSVPVRVVALEFSFVDALASLGIAPVGVADDGDKTRVIEQIRARIGEDWVSLGSRSQPSLEVIASLKPDLIIADRERHEAIYEDLKRIAPTLILKSRGETYQDNLKSVIKVASAFDREGEMAQKVAEHSQKMDAFAKQIDNDASLLFAVSSARGVYMHAPKAYAGGVVNRLGLRSPVPDETEAYVQTTIEGLVKANPDYFLVGEYGEETVIDTFKENSLWTLMSAVKNDHYVETDPRLWSLNRGMIAAKFG
ncbi:Fe(3+) dicitrate ABC transporter substrate-binding protein [Reinekea marina]|uniref:Fe(3+) dicitrate ABC transporter substrate-binding protein n=1 Tax=Reinekea marina TaxID=1310421 RepID=UPI0025B3DD5D|nr:Fe(3+) dicitrate ABC transporter substrate-binding protein [Reinekea marina]MDN3651102.1 Fe(3+) dicitrate ABC transporter substrate-binding protein [Reinekea marina]